MWTGTTSPWFPQFQVYRETPAGWDVAMAQLAAHVGTDQVQE